MNDVIPVVSFLQEMLETDNSIPRSVRERVGTVIQILETEEDRNLTVSKAVQELESLSEDAAMQSHTRTQVWSAVSMLEGIS